MSSKTEIEWTEFTWNPTVGCSKISAGCKYCYAETMAKRLQAMGSKGYENGFQFTLMPERLSQPLKRKKPTMYFVNSMSDLFHEDIPFSYIDKVVDVINQTPRHIYQVLTKRSVLMLEYFSARPVPPNMWLGVTVENVEHGIPRITDLKDINAQTAFLSCEPLLEDLGQIDLTGIHWVIVGGESGSKARAMEKSWAESIRDQCNQAGVAFFFKQWGMFGSDGMRRNKKDNGRVLAGKTWSEYPHVLQRKVML